VGNFLLEDETTYQLELPMMSSTRKNNKIIFFFWYNRRIRKILFINLCAVASLVCFLFKGRVIITFSSFSFFFLPPPAGLFFHVVGEGVVRLLKNGRQHISDRENYIDFRMRLLGEPGNISSTLLFTFFFQKI
jgi:hypothetical protein